MLAKVSEYKLAYGGAPLLDACELNHEDVVAAILSHGGNPMTPDKDEDTPLSRAARYNHVNVARMLISAGVNVPSVRSLDGRTPLSRACRYGMAEVAELLISHGADPNGASVDGTTPLMRAAGNGQPRTASLLISHGAEVNAVRCDNGQSALSIAAEGGSEEVVKLLLAHGAAADHVDSKGRTPLQLAAMKGHFGCCCQVLGAGVSHTVRDKDDRSAWHLARSSSKADCVALLESPAAVACLADPVATARRDPAGTGAAIEALGGRRPFDLAARWCEPWARVGALLDEFPAAVSADTVCAVVARGPEPGKDLAALVGRHAAAAGELAVAEGRFALGVAASSGCPAPTLALLAAANPAAAADDGCRRCLRKAFDALEGSGAAMVSAFACAGAVVFEEFARWRALQQSQTTPRSDLGGGDGGSDGGSDGGGVAWAAVVDALLAGGAGAEALLGEAAKAGALGAADDLVRRHHCTGTVRLALGPRLGASGRGAASLSAGAARAAVTTTARELGSVSGDAEVVAFFRRLGAFLGAYVLEPGAPVHRSATCVVIHAEHVGADDAKVTLKLMKNRDEFWREVSSRQGRDLDGIVVGVRALHLPPAGVGGGCGSAFAARVSAAAEAAAAEAAAAEAAAEAVARSEGLVCPEETEEGSEYPFVLVMERGGASLHAFLGSQRLGGYDAPAVARIFRSTVRQVHPRPHPATRRARSSWAPH